MTIKISQDKPNANRNFLETDCPIKIFQENKVSMDEISPKKKPEQSKFLNKVTIGNLNFSRNNEIKIVIPLNNLQLARPVYQLSCFHGPAHRKLFSGALNGQSGTDML